MHVYLCGYVFVVEVQQIQTHTHWQDAYIYVSGDGSGHDAYNMNGGVSEGWLGVGKSFVYILLATEERWVTSDLTMIKWRGYDSG